MSKKITNAELEKRIGNICGFYSRIESNIERLCGIIPENARDKVKPIIKKIIEDSELEKLIHGLENRRAPRFMLVGATCSGKSSLINAICGYYAAKVSDVEVGTRAMQPFECKRQEETILEALDTRGINEAKQSGQNTAERDLIDNMKSFNPDIILFVLEIGKRDNSINSEVKALNKLIKEYNKSVDMESLNIPVIAVLNKADSIEPTSQHNPKEYTENKLSNIKKGIEYYKSIFKSEGFTPDDIIAVSSHMEYECGNEEMGNLSYDERIKTELLTDDRYNIEELISMIEKNISDDAAAGLMLASRIDVVLKRVAKRFVNAFVSAAGIVGGVSLGISDIFVLIPLQIILIILIAALSGENLSVESAKKFLISAGSAGIFGKGLQLFFQQASKLGNFFFPGAGSALSGAIAAGGTKAIGEAAIAFYIEDKDLKKLKKEAKKKNKDEDI